MAEIVNLRQVRKTKARTEKDKAAQANRVLHGTPKRLRNLADARKDKDEQAHGGHRLEKPDADNRSVGESQSDQK
jgi:hypothetical protein